MNAPGYKAKCTFYKEFGVCAERNLPNRQTASKTPNTRILVNNPYAASETASGSILRSLLIGPLREISRFQNRVEGVLKGIRGYVLKGFGGPVDG